MKKMRAAVLAAAVLAAALLAGCDNLTTDLPNTDVSAYWKEADQKFVFPKDTPAVDIWQCLLWKGFPANGTRTVTSADSSLKITWDIQLADGTYPVYTRPVQRIELAYSEYAPEIHDYKITLILDDGSTNFYSNHSNIDTDPKQPGIQPRVYNCVFRYRWQRETTNNWENDKIPGELVIKP